MISYFCSSDFAYVFTSDLDYLSFSLSFEENTTSKICFFLSSNPFAYFYFSCCPNFKSEMPSSMEDLLLLNLLAFYSFVSFASLYSGYALCSTKVTGIVEPILDVFSIVVDNFLPRTSLTTSLLGVELFYLALNYRVILFFINEEDFITSYNFAD